MELIKFIITNPGEDTSKEMNISWHSLKKGSYLLLDNTNNLINKETYYPEEELWSTKQYGEKYLKDDSFYNQERYVCKLRLKNLKENTLYHYVVVVDDYYSKEMTFQTTGNNESFKFLSFVDTQHSYSMEAIEIMELFINKNKDAKLLTCSGDLVGSTGCEAEMSHIINRDYWNNIIFACAPGDHEYWGTTTRPYYMYERPFPFNHLFTFPDNGVIENTNYHFLYNNCLFISLDCHDSNTSSGEMFEKQLEYLNNLLSKKMNYKYIIVIMHKSIYGSTEIDRQVRINMNEPFSKMFDKFNVDLVISGHDHEYSRTYPLKDGVESEDGTVYFDIGSSGNKWRKTDDVMWERKEYAKLIDIKEEQKTLGAIITVNKEKISVEVRDLKYELVDSFEIKAKR